MKLKSLVNYDQCGGGYCPTFWRDEESGDFVFQGYKVEPSVREGINCPGNEDLVRIPASFWEQVKAYAKNSE